MGFLPLVEMTKYVWFFVIPTERGRSDEEPHSAVLGSEFWVVNVVVY